MQAREGRIRGGSVGSLEEMWKRKREEGEEKDIFTKKSKKMPRLPGGGRMGGEETREGKELKEEEGGVERIKRGNEGNDEGGDENGFKEMEGGDG